MTSNPNPTGELTPFTPEQWQQMNTMLNVTIPQQEDFLKRSKQAGLNVDDAITQLTAAKQQLTAIINAWKDKYK